MYLFDTDTLSELLRRAPSPHLVARLAQVPPEEQFTPAITVGEMAYGAHRSPKREHLLRQLDERVWPNVQVLSWDREAAETYGALRAHLERAGTPLSEPDMRIAAIALAPGLIVITRNARHLRRVPIFVWRTGSKAAWARC
jgi:predicted nucleic acid-binding protein